LPTTERIRKAAANLPCLVTLKILLSGGPLFFRGYGAGRTLAWYLNRRLQRA
jgi:hypothetical protein